MHEAFTAAMIGKLMDQGKLHWDDPLGKHIPGLVLPTIGDASEVTIRHALQHRTGLPNANMLWRSGQFDTDEILRRVRFLTPVAAPGEKMVYNNVMYVAAGKATEHAGGQPWGELIRTEFFEPLQMKRSVADSTKVEDFNNLAAPHANIDGQVRPIDRYDPEVIAPSGAIHSTAADMARWVMLQINRGDSRTRRSCRRNAWTRCTRRSSHQRKILPRRVSRKLSSAANRTRPP